MKYLNLGLRKSKVKMWYPYLSNRVSERARARVGRVGTTGSVAQTSAGLKLVGGGPQKPSQQGDQPARQSRRLRRWAGEVGEAREGAGPGRE